MEKFPTLKIRRILQLYLKPTPGTVSKSFFLFVSSWCVAVWLQKPRSVALLRTCQFCRAFVTRGLRFFIDLRSRFVVCLDESGDRKQRCDFHPPPAKDSSV